MKTKRARETQLGQLMTVNDRATTKVRNPWQTFLLSDPITIHVLDLIHGVSKPSTREPTQGETGCVSRTV